MLMGEMVLEREGFVFDGQKHSHVHLMRPIFEPRSLSVVLPTWPPFRV